MPIKSSPQEATQKWVNNLSASTTHIQAGVSRVTVAPGQKAAAQADKWLQRVTASKDKWRSRVGAVSLQDWQSAMVNVGIPRVAQGAQAKQSKFTAFATQFFPYLEQGVARVQSMPSTTLEQNIQRAVAMIQHNAQFKRSGGGS